MGTEESRGSAGSSYNPRPLQASSCGCAAPGHTSSVPAPKCPRVEPTVLKSWRHLGWRIRLWGEARGVTVGRVLALDSGPGMQGWESSERDRSSGLQLLSQKLPSLSKSKVGLPAEALKTDFITEAESPAVLVKSSVWGWRSVIKQVFGLTLWHLVTPKASQSSVGLRRATHPQFLLSFCVRESGVAVASGRGVARLPQRKVRLSSTSSPTSPSEPVASCILPRNVGLCRPLIVGKD